MITLGNLGVSTATIITLSQLAVEQSTADCSLQWRLELHYDGLKIVDSVTEYIAFNI